jgi:decaprenyl-phosphate phosphoribosyltransferase
MLNYLHIARIDHWIKNIFAIPGVILALMMFGAVEQFTLFRLLLGMAALCFLSSANYTINEFLDREFDSYHPIKKDRPGAKGNLKGGLVLFQYILISGVGLFISWTINEKFFLVGAILLAMGIVYNVEPIRSKDRAYLDVLSESINNPLRLLLGWFIVVNTGFPPSSILISYWMGGAFLMATKRLSEYKMIGDKVVAGSYRKSFKYYNEDSLLVSAFFYALNSTFFLGIFLIKYRIEYLLLFPLIAVLFAWYLQISFKNDSAAQAPEKLYKESALLIYVVFIAVAAVLLSVLNIPWLHNLQEPIY